MARLLASACADVTGWSDDVTGGGGAAAEPAYLRHVLVTAGVVCESERRESLLNSRLAFLLAACLHPGQVSRNRGGARRNSEGDTENLGNVVLSYQLLFKCVFLLVFAPPLLGTRLIYTLKMRKVSSEGCMGARRALVCVLLPR